MGGRSPKRKCRWKRSGCVSRAEGDSSAQEKHRGVARDMLMPIAVLFAGTLRTILPEFAPTERLTDTPSIATLMPPLGAESPIAVPHPAPSHFEMKVGFAMMG